jgi:hypothetical protein
MIIDEFWSGTWIYGLSDTACDYTIQISVTRYREFWSVLGFLDSPIQLVAILYRSVLHAIEFWSVLGFLDSPIQLVAILYRSVLHAIEFWSVLGFLDSPIQLVATLYRSVLHAIESFGVALGFLDSPIQPATTLYRSVLHTLVPSVTLFTSVLVTTPSADVPVFWHHGSPRATATATEFLS